MIKLKIIMEYNIILYLVPIIIITITTEIIINFIKANILNIIY